MVSNSPSADGSIPPLASKRPRPGSADSATLGRSWLYAIPILALGLLHATALWIGMGGWAEINNEWPQWRDDHPLYFHSARVTRDFLPQTWTTAGYDPTFMSGYPKSVVYPASSNLPELVLFLFGGSRPELAYKLYVFASAAAVPFLLAAAASLWGLSGRGVLAALAFFLVYVWTDFPINYAAFGMLPYLLAIPLSIVAVGAFVRWVEGGNARFWWMASALFCLCVLVHFTTAMVAAPAAALVYVVRLLRGKDPGLNANRIHFHLQVLAIPILVLVLNVFWWVPGVWLASTKGASDFAFAHPEGVLNRLSKILDTEPAIQRWLWVAGSVGACVGLRRSRIAFVGLLGFAGAGFFWGYLAGGLRSLDFLQPGRHTYACYTALAIAAGLAIDSTLSYLRHWRFRPDFLALALLIAGASWQFAEIVDLSVHYRIQGPYPFLSSKPSPRLLWVMSRLKRHVQAGERLLYEEGGFAVPGVPDPFQGGRFSGLLPWRLGIEVIGGPYLHAALTTNFTQFGENRLFGKEQWDRSWFERYARVYRPDAILCWTPWARSVCRLNPDLFEIREDDGTILIARIRGFGGSTIEGSAQVEARHGGLRVSAMQAGVDGSVVLRYHSVPCLRSVPPVAWDSVHLEGDPVPFIRLRPHPGIVTFELTFPPAKESEGGASR